MIKVASLFSGVGGFEQGIYDALGRENVEIVFSSEIDKFASRSYSLLHHHTPHGDITKIHEKDVPDHDLLVFGFPCQSFSISGRRLGFEDTRGTLFFEAARILKEKRPTYFIAENVKGLVNHDKGKTLQVILDTLKDIGYTVHTKVLNSKDHGNIPQNRERIFIVGSTDPNFSYSFPEEIPLTKRIKDVLEDEVDEKYYTNPKTLKSIEKSNYQSRKRIYSPNGVCGALTVGGDPKRVQLNRVRSITPLEAMRLQGFPDHYYHVLKENNISNTQIYRMAGNAVSPPVIKRLVEELFKDEKS